MAIMRKVLSVAELCKKYRDGLAVDNISFDVGKKEIVGLLGPNGAGKTTTISMILGVLRPSSGTIFIEGVDVEGNRSQAVERTNFAAVYTPLPGNLTVYQNLRVFGLLYGVTNLTERIDVVLHQFEIRPFRDVKYGVLSSGEQTRLSLAKAMLNRPHLLLLGSISCRCSLEPSSYGISWSVSCRG
jgi:ABC-2 type transport system ATP-binding protein